MAHLHEVLPWGVYFAQDHDVRFYMLFGDILNRDRAALTIKPTRSGREKKIEMTGVQTQTFFNRLIQASVYLLHYCRPAGIVPQPAIEALLAEFDIEEHSGWNYERIYAHFQNEIATGFSMRATPGT